MIRYLVAVVLLALCGVLLLAFNCAPLERSDYPLQISKVSVETRTVSLTQTEASKVSWQLALSWKGLVSGDGEAVIVDKRVSGDFQIKDTLRPVSEEMYFEDTDTLDLDKEVTYRLLLLNQGRATVLETLSRPPLTGMVFHVSDTVLPRDNIIRLSWEPVAEEALYEVKLMTLETLVPQPQGQRVASQSFRRSDAKSIYWSVDVSDLNPGANYILQVSATLNDSIWNRTVTGSRLFVLGAPAKTEKNK